MLRRAWTTPPRGRPGPKNKPPTHAAGRPPRSINLPRSRQRACLSFLLGMDWLDRSIDRSIDLLGFAAQRTLADQELQLSSSEAMSWHFGCMLDLDRLIPPPNHVLTTATHTRRITHPHADAEDARHGRMGRSSTSALAAAWGVLLLVGCVLRWL